MNISRSKKMNKTVAILAGGVIVLLILGQAVYFGLVKLYPDLVSDQQGIANGLASKVLSAQLKYRDQNGVFAKDLKSLTDISLHGEKYHVGYVNDFPEQIGSLCGDCVYQEETYKVLMAIKWSKGTTVWSLDSQGKLQQIESVRGWPFQ